MTKKGVDTIKEPSNGSFDFRDKQKQARTYLGQALHTLQDFYSHSNWVEQGNEEINTALGRKVWGLAPADIDAQCSIPGYPLTQGSKDGVGLNIKTGKGVTTGHFWVFNYVNEGFDQFGNNTCGYELLTSTLPFSAKCNHGGILGCGGINKDNAARVGHQVALKLANEATVDYVNQIIEELGDNDYAKCAFVGEDVSICFNKCPSEYVDNQLVEHRCEVQETGGYDSTQPIVTVNRYHNGDFLDSKVINHPDFSVDYDTSRLICDIPELCRHISYFVTRPGVHGVLRNESFTHTSPVSSLATGLENATYHDGGRSEKMEDYYNYGHYHEYRITTELKYIAQGGGRHYTVSTYPAYIFLPTPTLFFLAVKLDGTPTYCSINDDDWSTIDRSEAEAEALGDCARRTKLIFNAWHRTIDPARIPTW